jgi:hypothetical protein
MAQAKTETPSAPLVSETGEFPARSSNRRDSKKRRRRGRSLERGSIFSALHEASVEMFSAHVDAMQDIVKSYRERSDSTRDDDSDNHWAFDMKDNVNESLWDGYDRLVNIPKRVRQVYRDERDRDDD